MKKFLFLSGLSLLLTSSCNNTGRSGVSDALSKAEVTEVGGIKVLNLRGTWHEMGIQYGSLAKDNLLHVYEYICGRTDGHPDNDAAVSNTAELLMSQYPENLRDFMNGVSESSGMSLEQLKRINAIEYAEGDFFCSGLAVWGDYSSQSLLYGRNYDCVSYSEICSDVIVTVFHPDGDALATAIVGYAGEVYAVNAINERGLFFALDNGMPSAGSEIHYDMPQSTIELFLEMFSAGNVDDMDGFFKKTRSSASFIIGVADPSEARSYEWCYDGMKRGDLCCPQGVVAIANHYVNEDWPYPVPSNEKSWNSIIRRSNLLSGAELHKGELTAESMMEIMGTSISEGGPMHDLTRYQLVVEPASLTMWIRVIGYCGWTRLNLGQYLLGES